MGNEHVDEQFRQILEGVSPRASAFHFREWHIPERMMGGLRRYIDQHIPPGDFLQAVLRNDLTEAVLRADDENMANLPAYVAYLYNEAPSQCHGSRENVSAWLNDGPRVGPQETA